MNKPFALAVALCLCAGAAAAQSSPWYLGLSQTIGRDDNVFRLPGGQELDSGLISATRLVGGLDLRPGRQRLAADLSLSHNRYADQRQLDFDGYALSATLDWETVRNLSGQLSASLERRQGSFNTANTPTGEGRNIEEPRRVAALFRVGDARQSRLWVELDLSHDDLSSDVDLQTPRTLLNVPLATAYARSHRITGGGVQLRHRRSGALVLGVGVNALRGQETYDVQSLLGAGEVRDDYERQDLDLTADWTPTGASRVFARLSYGRTDADTNLLRRDRQGFSSALRWSWEPGGRWALQTRLAYDANTRERIDGLGSADEPATALSLQGRYQIGAKLSATAGGSLVSRRLEPGVSGGRNDERRSADIGLEWQALRNVGLGCSVSLSTRNRSAASDGYSAMGSFCTLRAVLQ